MFLIMKHHDKSNFGERHYFLTLPHHKPNYRKSGQDLKPGMNQEAKDDVEAGLGENIYGQFLITIDIIIIINTIIIIIVLYETVSCFSPQWLQIFYTPKLMYL